MKRKGVRFAVIAALLCLCVSLACACRSNDKKLDPIDESSVKITEKAESFIVSWMPLIGADKYIVSVNGKKFETEEFRFDLRSKGVVLPADGTVKISIVARGAGYADSAPVSKTYTTEGLVLRTPQVISFENGTLTWRQVGGASSYILKVGGQLVWDNEADYTYSKTSYTLTDTSKDTDIQIVAMGDNVWLKDSPATNVQYSAAERKLILNPVTCSLNGETLSWGAISGVSGYRVVDLEFNTLVTTKTEIELSDSQLVYGVFPISSVDFIADAAIKSTDAIPYLEGRGTYDNPYRIKTAFDLRAIDYYEMKNALDNAGKSEQEKTKKYYRIENDIDYNSVDKLEGESNLYTLSKPFCGVLDGNGKTLSNIRVIYDGGYWSLFDYIAPGAEVKNITFKTVSISNEMQDNEHPVNASIATVAYQNYGKITDITVQDANYVASGGEVAGIAFRNYGTVSGCSVSGLLKQKSTEYPGQGCFAMGGVVVENCTGGKVVGCTAYNIKIEGDKTWGGKSVNDKWVFDKTAVYNIIMSVGGIVAVNRGGTVSANKLVSLTVTGLNEQCGGIVGTRESGTVSDDNDTSGTMSVGTSTTSSATTAVTDLTGKSSNKYVGKKWGK